MAHDPFNAHLFPLREFFDEGGDLFRAHPKPPHAGVNLQVNIHRGTEGRGLFRNLFEHFNPCDDRGKPVPEGTGRLFPGHDPAQYQQGRRDPALPQLNPLLHGCQPKVIDSDCLVPSGHRHCTVPVSVSLDDAECFYGSRHQGPDRSVVGFEGVQIDGNQSAACGQSRSFMDLNVRS